MRSRAAGARRAVGEWAAALDGPALVRRSETEGVDAFALASKGLAELGVAGIALPDDLGGGGGSLLDLAVAVEACAGAMVPGALVPTAASALALAATGPTLVTRCLSIAGGTTQVLLNVVGERILGLPRD